jgi:hypothetical protein
MLCLAAVLGVLPGLNTASAVPAPKRPKLPTIYALIYVGLGKNDPDNAKRIAGALEDLRGYGARGAVRDPKVNALPIVQDTERKLGWIGRDDWAKSKTRVTSLEGTAIVRVWFTEGDPEEQVLIINAIARAYVNNQQEIFRDAVKALEREKVDYIKANNRPLNKEEERTFRRRGEAVKHLPHVIEWANLTEKP